MISNCFSQYQFDFKRFKSRIRHVFLDYPKHHLSLIFNDKPVKLNFADVNMAFDGVLFDF